jgi:hypothetical protein
LRGGLHDEFCRAMRVTGRDASKSEAIRVLVR